MKYEQVNHRMLFRVVHTKKGTFRTVSKYFLVEIEEMISMIDPVGCTKAKVRRRRQQVTKYRSDLHTELDRDLSTERPAVGP